MSDLRERVAEQIRALNNTFLSLFGDSIEYAIADRILSLFDEERRALSMEADTLELRFAEAEVRAEAAEARVKTLEEERRALKESVTDAQAQVIEWASRCGRLVSAKEAAEARVKQVEAENAMYKSAIEQHACKIEELREAVKETEWGDRRYSTTSSIVPRVCYCPSCGNQYRDGHAQNCIVAAALGKEENPGRIQRELDDTMEKNDRYLRSCEREE